MEAPPRQTNPVAYALSSYTTVCKHRNEYRMGLSRTKTLPPTIFMYKPYHWSGTKPTARHFSSAASYTNLPSTSTTSSGHKHTLPAAQLAQNKEKVTQTAGVTLSPRSANGCPGLTPWGTATSKVWWRAPCCSSRRIRICMPGITFSGQVTLTGWLFTTTLNSPPGDTPGGTVAMYTFDRCPIPHGYRGRRPLERGESTISTLKGIHQKGYGPKTLNHDR